jgi:uncharacterized membrane protein YjgN (DUF898 family)
MASDKTFEFKGTAGGYFVVFLVTLIGSYIPLFGWAFVFNFTNNWVAENAVVNGKQVSYKAGYGETLKFIFINLLLILITLGIYTFWFVPKSYRYIADHLEFGGDAAPAFATVETATQPPAPTPAPTAPAAADAAPAAKPVIVQ